MSKNKLYKFGQLATFSNVYQNHRTDDDFVTDYRGEAVDIKGKWDEHHFQNGKPITLELACGGGEYTLGLARMYPDRNFIGIDIKGARIWKGARVAVAESLDNAAFCRMRIDHITKFFAPNEVAEVWITFPDPFLKKERRRLTSPMFIPRYREVLQPGAKINLKTDDPTLYEYTLEIIESENLILEYHNDDIYADELPLPELGIQTFYEAMHLENKKTIKYVRFRLD